MVKKLKLLHELYKKERYKQNVQHLPDPRTGISPAEKGRLLKFPDFTEGEVSFFQRPFYFSDAKGFLHSVEEIFGDETYKFVSTSDSPYILDCGANMGLSIAYFKKLYPNAEIIAFEPDERTFQLLKKNTLQYDSLVLLKNEAVWTEDTALTFFSEGSLAGSVVVDFAKKRETHTVKAIDFKKYLNRKVDFLKIDIEGAENQLIFDIQKHLHHVENMFLEYHGIAGRQQNLGDILNLLTQEGFQYYIRVAGESMKYPFCKEAPTVFNQQLNIFCFRK